MTATRPAVSSCVNQQNRQEVVFDHFVFIKHTPGLTKKYTGHYSLSLVLHMHDIRHQTPDMSRVIMCVYIASHKYSVMKLTTAHKTEVDISGFCAVRFY